MVACQYSRVGKKAVRKAGVEASGEMRGSSGKEREQSLFYLHVSRAAQSLGCTLRVDRNKKSGRSKEYKKKRALQVVWNNAAKSRRQGDLLTATAAGSSL
jgi:hypothetical protein